MKDAIAFMGLGYKGPSYYALRCTLLQDMKNDVRLVVDSYRSVWTDTGCTIMGDGWKNSRSRSLINFLVYCPKGVSFIKSVDASDFVTNAQTLCNLFEEIIEFVGPHNVVHLVTDNGSNYKAAGRLISDKFYHISWSPCAAHCLNLISKDLQICLMWRVLAVHASSISVFVYNHKWTLGWLRKQPKWTKIIRPGPTRFATTFIALKSIYDRYHELQTMVTSKEFNLWSGSKSKRGKKIKDIVLAKMLWNDCLIIIKIVSPLLRLLRIVDSNEKPALGYVYEGMYRARKGIKETFQNKKRLYKPYTKIVKERWDKLLRRDIHAAAHWLNPAFQYNQLTFSHKSEVMNGLLEVIETKVTCKKAKLLDEIRLFREREKGFGRNLALSTCQSMRLDEWWRMFGHDAPNLKNLAIRLLSQTASSSGCERNWSAFERIHTNVRNRLEHERLNDLVYVHYNLRLKNRFVLYYTKLVIFLVNS
ncbi:hypothetical protein AXF42_Ash010130 [Apostasia shenzhenica]|uniref:DUF659 domain-containing protein n=1 Tax=Apostasia shenzhenica TaxID=1088818 RepID=A0A2I0A9M6_9ASPA|nr:hypothetical protein AXF42_Ash010130 [Apostasia shenzhenica]